MWESFPQKLVSTDTISVDFHTESPVARRTSRQIDVIDSEKRTALLSAPPRGALSKAARFSGRRGQCVALHCRTSSSEMT